jgi:hypothetical protein
MDGEDGEDGECLQVSHFAFEGFSKFDMRARYYETEDGERRVELEQF